MDYFRVEDSQANSVLAQAGVKDLKGKNGKSFKRLYYNYDHGGKIGQPLFMMLGVKGNIKLAEDKGDEGPQKSDDEKEVKMTIQLDNENYYNGLMQLELGRRQCIFNNRAALGKNSFTVENPGDNHHGIIFEPLGPDGTPNGTRFLSLKFRYDSLVLMMGYDEATGQPTETKTDIRSLLGHSVEGIVTCYLMCDSLVNNNLYPQIYVRKLNVVKALPKADVDYRNDTAIQDYFTNIIKNDPDALKSLASMVAKAQEEQEKKVKVSSEASKSTTQAPSQTPSAAPQMPLQMPPQMPPGMPHVSGGPQIPQNMMYQGQNMPTGASIPQGMMSMISNHHNVPTQPPSSQMPNYGNNGYAPPTGTDMNQFFAQMYNPNMVAKPM